MKFLDKFFDEFSVLTRKMTGNRMNQNPVNLQSTETSSKLLTCKFGNQLMFELRYSLFSATPAKWKQLIKNGFLFLQKEFLHRIFCVPVAMSVNPIVSKKVVSRFAMKFRLSGLWFCQIHIHSCNFMIPALLLYEVNDPLLQVCYKP